MRVPIFAFTVVTGLIAIAGSTQAAPVAPHNPYVTARAITQAATKCASGFRRNKWQDRSGKWHQGSCVPNANR